MDQTAIGRKIKRARLEAGLSQRDLGDQIGISWEMISRIENGRSSAIKHIQRISEILGKSVGYLLSIESDYASQRPEQLAAMLREQGLQYNVGQPHNQFPILELVENIHSYDDVKKEASLYYAVPDWVCHKYSPGFALPLKHLRITDIIEYGANDIAIFWTTEEIKFDYIVLLKVGEEFVIDKFSNLPGEDNNILGVLVYVERRYLS